MSRPRTPILTRRVLALVAVVSALAMPVSWVVPPAVVAAPGSPSFRSAEGGSAALNAATTVRPVGRGAGSDVEPWSPPQPGYRIRVRNDGLYRLSYGDLVSAGVPVDQLGPLGPSGLQVFHYGQEVAIWVEGESDGVFDVDDYVLLYGQALESKYTWSNVYWLTYGTAAGKRMSVRDGTPPGTPAAAYHMDALHFESNLFYAGHVPGSDDLDRFLWGYAAPGVPDFTHSFALAAPYGYAGGVLRVSLYGHDSNTWPRARVYLNDQLLDDSVWQLGTWLTVTAEIPAGLLTGSNTLRVNCPVSGDAVYVDWAEVEFANTFVATGDVLEFDYGTPGEVEFHATGFESGDVALFDVTDPLAAERISGAQVDPSGGGFSVAFGDEVGEETRYWLGAAQGMLSVEGIEEDTPSHLGSSQNGADYILIAPALFAQEVAPLAAYRAGQGLRAMQVDVQDVYDEFGYGVVGAEPIRGFLDYAYHSWQLPAPKYVLLVGDGHYDPKDYLGYGRMSYMPPYLAFVDPWLGETASDNRYVTVEGSDTFPEMIIGRLPVNSAAEAATVVNKTIQYETNPAPGAWRSKVLFVADDADAGGDFAALSDAMIDCCLPDGYEASKVYYLVTHSTPSLARQAIVAAINEGRLLVNYEGHGNTSTWAGEYLLRTTDIPSMNNATMLPVVLSMTCKDGYFIEPYVSAGHSLAESLVRADGRGAVAAWAPTGMGVSTGHDLLDRGFFDAVFEGGVTTVGEAALAGKQRLFDGHFALDLLDTYHLFGDPALRILSTASIGDRLWMDENGDSIQDTGEPGIANAAVGLYDASGSVLLATTVTDAEGGYLFTNLRPGTYVVRVDTTTMPAGLAANETFDPDGSTDHQTSVVLMGGRDQMTVDFGYNWVAATDTADPPAGATGTIGGHVWIDSDADGLHAPGEAGLSGIAVALWYDSDGDGALDAVYATAETGPGGRCFFDELPARTYRLTLNGGAAPPGYTQTGDPDGVLDNASTPFPLAPGDVYLVEGFGYLPGTGSSAGDRVYEDLDADGTWDASEPGIPGVTMALLDGGGTVVATALTGPGGEYEFGGLPAGTWTVWVNDTGHALAGLGQTGDPDAVLDGRHTLVMDGSSSYPDIGFGYAPVGHEPGEGLIGDTVFLDVNPLDGNAYVPGVDSALGGLQVDLYAANGTTLLGTRVTDQRGGYAFGGLNPQGTYVVAVNVNSLPAAVASSVDPDLAYDGRTTIGLSAYPGGLCLSADFGFSAETPNVVSGLVWEDIDSDGILEMGEPPIAGVTMVLSDAGGRVVGTATSTAGGYSFTGLPDGTYSVDVTDDVGLLAGWWHTDGPSDGSDGNSQDVPYLVSVAGGATDATADFGYYVTPASLGDWLWYDMGGTSGNGIQDPSEAGIAGAKILLSITYPNGAETRLQATTAADGTYQFDGLLLDESLDGAGSDEPAYSVQVDMGSLSGYAPSPQDMTTEDKDSDNPYGEPVVSPGGLSRGSLQSDYDFGFFQSPTNVVLLSFAAAWEDSQRVGVEWRTAAEIDNLGFNVYRAHPCDGPLTQVNLELIQSLVPPGSGQGADYEWPDDTVVPGEAYCYWLEDVDVDGGSTMHGPALAVRARVLLPLALR